MKDFSLNEYLEDLKLLCAIDSGQGNGPGGLGCCGPCGGALHTGEAHMLTHTVKQCLDLMTELLRRVLG